jgi:hypothetical protein
VAKAEGGGGAIRRVWSISFEFRFFTYLRNVGYWIWLGGWLVERTVDEEEEEEEKKGKRRGRLRRNREGGGEVLCRWERIC